MSNPDINEDLHQVLFHDDEFPAEETDRERERMEEISEMDHRDDMKEDQFMSDGEADEDAMSSAGMGEDESYGCFCGGEE
jgi:hypothetical protein